MLVKRIIAFALAAGLAVSSSLAAAEENDTYIPTASEIALTGRPVSDEPTHVTVGSTTKVSGSFWTTQFGNNTSDVDVRTMIHGYCPVAWTSQLEFSEDPTVVSGISKTTSGGNTVYTVSLNRNLFWNDGETGITAADYVFAHLLLASDEMAEIGANTGVWEHIVGYDEYAAGETDVFSGVRLLSNYSYSITVKGDYEPYFYELAYLAVCPYPISVIAPGCKVADDGKGAYIANEDSTAEEPLFTADLLKKTILDSENGYMSHPQMTCGPYNLTSYDPESGKVDFALNPYYLGNYEGVKPVIDTVTLVPVSTDTMVEQLANGEVDILNKCVDGDVIAAARAYIGEGFSMQSYARLGYGFLAFACEMGPQQFTKVRQAIAYAFDTEKFTQDFLRGYGLTVKGYYGIGQWTTEAAYGNVRPEEMTEAESAAWDELTLDSLNDYDYDLDKAKQLLIEDGWTLNADGTAYGETDTVRYKDVDGTLMALSFDFALTEGNAAAQMAVDMLQESFSQLGAELVVHEVPFTEMLSDYYSTDGTRQYDMAFLATNFVSPFDPYLHFAVTDDLAGAVNNSGLRDQELSDLAWKMHTTEPYDLLTYEQRWLAFQERFNEILPTLPIYSNVYFDFISDYVHNYYANSEYSWPAALLYAYWGEPETETEEDGGTVTIE